MVGKEKKKNDMDDSAADAPIYRAILCMECWKRIIIEEGEERKTQEKRKEQEKEKISGGIKNLGSRGESLPFPPPRLIKKKR